MASQHNERPVPALAEDRPHDFCRLWRPDNFHLGPTPAPTQARNRAEKTWARICALQVKIVRLKRRCK